MQLSLKLEIPPLARQINLGDNILLTGSCFTEHIADRLCQNKFNMLSNPHGIIFNPLSVADNLTSYLTGRKYLENDLFFLNELWNSWEHHTIFSALEKEEALYQINRSQAAATEFIKKADWLIITLGSAFQYYLKDTAKPVANNHRAPAQWFEKKLLPIDDIISALDATLSLLFSVNKNAQVIFTISPVRHIRDGVIENNRSKARLLESVHTICDKWDKAHYFPAYELVIDILRDYRFYDIDFVHPNYLATNIVWEHFVNSCIAENDKETMKQIQDITTAKAHRTRFPQTQAHKKFKETYLEKTILLKTKLPFLNLEEEIAYFTSNT